MKVGICILAGGLSSRFGRDKSRVRFGRRTMLSVIRATAQELDLPVRVIRHDRVPRCGPLGGILTGLESTRADAVLFLACDMPLVTAELLRKMIEASGDGSRAVYAACDSRRGFPLLLPTTVVPIVEAHIAARSFSIHELVDGLRPRAVWIRTGKDALLNVNTIEEAQMAGRMLAHSAKKKRLNRRDAEAQRGTRE